ncbi:MAG: DNA-directed RNA polymerase subunit F [Candidatus Micrarchaeota archaeon]|nr:DNA-directed RNA polymerase subunit F [Candidatus Micrarchaeota archaeon]
MIGKEHISQHPVPMAEALDILKERKKAGELGYEQDLAFKHAEKYAALSVDKAKKLSEELSELPGMSPKVIVKDVDILPITEAQAKNTFLIDKAAIEGADAKKVVEVVSKYKGK